jgi:hypothetical protein
MRKRYKGRSPYRESKDADRPLGHASSLGGSSSGGLTHELCYAYHAIGWGEEGAGTPQGK